MFDSFDTACFAQSRGIALLVYCALDHCFSVVQRAIGSFQVRMDFAFYTLCMFLVLFASRAWQCSRVPARHSRRCFDGLRLSSFQVVCCPWVAFS